MLQGFVVCIWAIDQLSLPLKRHKYPQIITKLTKTFIHWYCFVSNILLERGLVDLFQVLYDIVWVVIFPALIRLRWSAQWSGVKNTSDKTYRRHKDARRSGVKRKKTTGWARSHSLSATEPAPTWLPSSLHTGKKWLTPLSFPAGSKQKTQTPSKAVKAWMCYGKGLTHSLIHTSNKFPLNGRLFLWKCGNANVKVSTSIWWNYSFCEPGLPIQTLHPRLPAYTPILTLPKHTVTPWLGPSHFNAHLTTSVLTQLQT